MGQPVVFLEILGTDPHSLRTFYSSLFKWEFSSTGEAAEGAR